MTSLATAYDRSISPGWESAAKACDAVHVLLRAWGSGELRRTGLALAALDVAREADDALGMLATIEARAWGVRTDEARALVESAVRNARVELLLAGEEAAARVSVRPEEAADTERPEASS